MLKSLFDNLARRRGRRLAREYFEGDLYDPVVLTRAATRKAEFLKREGLLDYPAIVHLETVAACNAACTFCPYPTMPRKGTRMSDALIEKVIDDLTAIPRHVSFQFAPYKVSDPFVEARLFDILARVNERLPNAMVSLITNGSALTDAKLDQLARVRNLAYVHVSLNYDNAEEYEAVMKLPFARTLERLEALHRRHAEGSIDCPVRVGRVTSTRGEDIAFRLWVQANFPRFGLALAPRHDWIGEVAGMDAAAVPDAPCHRWFDLSITATGVVSMCCMDGLAKYPKGDVNTQHALEIYNLPWLRELRTTLKSRRAAGSPCDRCTYLSF
ncbi:MAG: radical SAM/SPASM domain-containing protein [Burkholderiales bacterium]